MLNCGLSAEGRGEHLFDPRRGAENGNCRTATATSFCPRRAAKGHEERQQQRQLLVVHEPRRGTKNGNFGNFVVHEGPRGARRTATAERQRQLLFVHEGPRRGRATAPQRQLLVVRKELRARTRQLAATSASFCPQRATIGARRTATAERQRQLLFVHEGPRRGTKNGNCRTATATATSFCPRKGHDRGTKNGNCRTATATATSFCPQRATKGHEERQLQNGNGNFFLSTKGREWARRTATAERQRQLLFVHEGPRRGTKNTFLSTKGRYEHSFVVAADRYCRTGDLGEEGAGSACRRHELA